MNIFQRTLLRKFFNRNFPPSCAYFSRASFAASFAMAFTPAFVKLFPAFFVIFFSTLRENSADSSSISPGETISRSIASNCLEKFSLTSSPNFSANSSISASPAPTIRSTISSPKPESSTFSAAPDKPLVAIKARPIWKTSSAIATTSQPT